MSHNAREPVVFLMKPIEQLEFILGDELQSIDVVAELVELAKRACERHFVGGQQNRCNAVELARRIMLHLPIGFDFSLQPDDFVGLTVDPAEHVQAHCSHHNQEDLDRKECRQKLNLNASWRVWLQPGSCE